MSRISDHFPVYGMKILLGDFSAVLGKEDIFTPVIGNGSLYANSNESSVESYIFLRKQKIIKSTVLQHRIIRPIVFS
jgi:hypothetical protein